LPVANRIVRRDRSERVNERRLAVGRIDARAHHPQEGCGRTPGAPFPCPSCCRSWTPSHRISSHHLLLEAGRRRYDLIINLPRCRCACDRSKSAGFFVVVRKALATRHGRGILENFTVQVAGVAQSAEHRFCKPRVESSSLSASSVIRLPANSPGNSSQRDREWVSTHWWKRRKPGTKRVDTQAAKGARL
jgi:hypothetical protein